MAMIKSGVSDNSSAKAMIESRYAMIADIMAEAKVHIPHSSKKNEIKPTGPDHIIDANLFQNSDVSIVPTVGSRKAKASSPPITPEKKLTS